MPDLDSIPKEFDEAPQPSTLTLTSDQEEAAGIVAAEPGSTYELTVTIQISEAGDVLTADIVEARDAVETSTQEEPAEPITEPPPARPLPSRKGPGAFGMTEAPQEEEA